MFMPLDEAMRGRYSCRAFLPKPVPREALDEMFALAQLTPSWCNSQAWQVHVTTGDATERLRTALVSATSGTDVDAVGSDVPLPAEYTGEYKQRRRDAGFALYNAVGIARDDFESRNAQMAENFRFFGAPHLLVVTSPKALGPYGLIDCGGYVAELMLAAHAAGLATIAQGSIAMYSPVVRGELSIAEDRDIVCGISLGYADESHPANTFRTTRASVADAVTFVES